MRTIKELIEFQLERTACKGRFYLVALHMADLNHAAVMVMMNIVDVMHETGQDYVHTTHSQWQREIGIGRSKLANALEVLEKSGFSYTAVAGDALGQEWRINRAMFFTEFEKALMLVCPDLPPDDPTPPDDGEHGEDSQHVAENHENSGSTGETSAESAQHEHLIDKRDIQNKNKGNGVALLERYRVKFSGSIEAFADRMLVAISSLGEVMAREVINRCVRAGGRSWAYVAKSLDSEVLALNQPQQPLPVSEGTKHEQHQPRQAFEGCARVVDGVPLVKRYTNYGKYEWVSQAQIERESDEAAREAARRELDRQRWMASDAQQSDADHTEHIPAVATSAETTALPDLTKGESVSVEPNISATPPAYTPQEAEAWNTAQLQLQFQIERGKYSYLDGARLLSVQANRFVIEVISHYARELFQHRLYRIVQRIVSNTLGREVSIEFVYQERAAAI